MNSLSRPKYAHSFKPEAAQHHRQWNLNLVTGNKAVMNLSSVNLHPVKESLFMMRDYWAILLWTMHNVATRIPKVSKELPTYHKTSVLYRT